MVRPTSFSTRIAISFGAMVLVGILLAEAVWYLGLPGDMFRGAREARLLEASRFLAFSANQRVTTLSASIAQRRGDLLLLAESDKLLGAMARQDTAGLQKQLGQSLSQLERAYPAAYRVLRVMDPTSGLILASSQEGETGQRLRESGLLSRATQPGVSELLEETFGPTGASLTVIRPLVERDDEGYPVGGVRGVLMADLGVNAMLAAGIGNDRDGDRQPGITLILSHDGRPLARFPEGQESDQAFWQVARQPSGFEGALQLADGNGAPYLAVYRNIPLSGSKSLTLIHYETVAEALRDLQGQLAAALWAGMGLAVAALGVLLYWARHLTVPLRRLADVADQLGRGVMSVRAPVGMGESREVENLSKAFNDMADSLDKNRQRLEDQVRERTQALNEKRALEASLIQARDMAESANRAKSTFLSNMSHELRTPLNAVLGFAQLMQMDRQLSPASQDKLAVINRAGRHLLGLIDEVLEISRIESGQSLAVQAPFDLMRLLASVEEMIRVRADGKALNFKVVYGPDLPDIVEGDEPHLKQVLINLLGNAVKYTDHGSVTLQIRRQGVDLVFEVTDTGPGISTEDQARIFQPFYQTGEGMAKGEGSGLGLAISLHYARLMGGQLTVSSQLGQGSHFTLRLPLPASDRSVELGAESTGVAELEPGQSEVRVLVVDDNADNREVAGLLLARAHFSVRVVNNGQQALDEYERWHPQCICMDMRMPIMDGYEATQRIRALPNGDGVKIIALTASAFEEDRQRMLDAGCDAVVRKPLEADKLIALIGELLGLRLRSSHHL